MRCGVVRCGLKFSQNHNHTTSHFCDHICGAVYKMRFEWLKFVYFSNFGLFLPSPKLIFSLCFGPVLNYWVSFSLFWVGFPNQYLLGLSNYFFLFKTRLIKLLIIYLILKIIKYINIYREVVVRCGAERCNITCGAMQLCHFVGGFDAVFAVWWTPLVWCIVIFIIFGN